MPAVKGQKFKQYSLEIKMEAIHSSLGGRLDVSQNHGEVWHERQTTSQKIELKRISIFTTNIDHNEN
ncbi:hypothetical protein [Paenibacillus sp. FSL R5-0486]|uniref:hypothetical protein n=1 Tax=Paenibacillus sp. FSL R5-0486 TaxID=2921645 RepID=UPI0030D97FC2